ncbi:MAG TPA: alpha/beta fold hydrolase [Vitreimonas sp.]|uniref:alpha/beta hydrolase n=1 Tax=Vitreimonas sp. TaxID=3069702 RepID=UPI002D52C4FF|nr:alpha/beta fold hydrolase [Vitreimonas sp.]HYD89707.1 alpha/beta fold hydrolase [Vitreimonas sp.]
MKRNSDATPVVFVHGAFCGGWAFDAFREPFEAAGFETHAPNLPHHERGADLEQLALSGLKDYAHAVTTYVRGLRAPPVLIGHSLGGLVSQITAMHADVAGLVLLAPSPPWGVPPTTLDEHGHQFGLTLLGDYWRRPVPPDYRVARTTTLDRLTREDARRAFARFVPESGRAIREAVQWWADHSMASQAPVYRIKAPVLGLAGGKDRVNPSSTVRRVLARFPGAQAHFHEFPEMSHWLVGEPEAPDVAKLTLQWFDARGIGPKPTKKKRQLSLFGWGDSAGA